MKLINLLVGPAMAAALLYAASAGATATVGSSLGFSPATLIDFEQAAPDSNINSYYASQGVTFNTLYETYGYEFPPNLSGGGATNFTPIGNTGSAQDFYIQFATTQHNVGFAFVADSAATFSTYFGSTLVESINAGTGTGINDIVSFTNSNFDRIVFTGSGDHAVLIDNLGFNGTTVPEPSTWALMIAGFGLVGVATRRRSIGAAA